MNSVAITQNPGSGSPLRRFSNLLYRRPNFYLSLLLVPPLLWFGAIYLGSLLVLLWQGFYTFDDFTMAVTPDLTLANLAALFQPSNFDIILRTLSMAIVVSIASAIVAFPIAYYMARYTTGKTKAFFYIAVMMPMWASYIVKAYAWTLLLAKGGVAQWFVQVLHLDGLLHLRQRCDGVRTPRLAHLLHVGRIGDGGQDREGDDGKHCKRDAAQQNQAQGAGEAGHRHRFRLRVSWPRSIEEATSTRIGMQGAAGSSQGLR